MLVLDPMCAVFDNNPNPNLSSGCPRIQDPSSGCPGIQHLSSGCPRIQELSSGCPGRQMLPDKLFFCSSRIFIFSPIDLCPLYAFPFRANARHACWNGAHAQATVVSLCTVCTGALHMPQILQKTMHTTMPHICFFQLLSKRCCLFCVSVCLYVFDFSCPTQNYTHT